MSYMAAWFVVLWLWLKCDPHLTGVSREGDEREQRNQTSAA